MKQYFSFKRIVLSGLSLSVLYLLFNFFSVWSASNEEYQGTSGAAIVLGAAQYNGEPSPVLKARLETAGDLYLQNRVQLVVVTGGGQEGDITTEAKTGYDFLSAGRFTIAESDLKLEVDGTSTYESIAASARFLKDDGVTNVIVVTDPYHAKRSELIAEEVGLNAEVYVTSGDSSFKSLFRESLSISVGRIISFRRLDSIL